MIIDFAKIDESFLKNFYGGEKELIARKYEDGLNRILKGKLESGSSIGMHTHETGSEIIFILSGHGKVLYDDTEEKVEAGMCHYCPKGHSHSLINTSDKDLIFFAVVTVQ